MKSQEKGLTYVVGSFIIRRICTVADHNLGSDRRYTVNNDEQVALSADQQCFDTVQDTTYRSRWIHVSIRRVLKLNHASRSNFDNFEFDQTLINSNTMSSETTVYASAQ